MKDNFQRAWSLTQDAYARSRINSERTLQALLYSSLSSLLEPADIVICEPSIVLQNKGQYIPDMLVIRGDEVIAAVELKFVPHHYPHFRDDLEKLKTYAHSRDHFHLLLDPNTGCFTDRQFNFAPDCLLVFGVVGQHDSEAAHEQTLLDLMREYKNRFIPLVLQVGIQR